MAPVAVPAAVPPPAPGPGAFVGRSTELRRLKAAWADTRAGRRRTMLVAGEAGIGKTRLATELASQAERDGSVVLAGRCDQHLGVPYLPLREAVGRHLASYPSERLRGLLGPRAAELVRFWPELAWRLPTLPAPSAIGPAADPYLLLEALTGLLEAIAVTSPLLLLVDDLHGADEGSLLLLRSLAGARRPARLLTVLTYRDDERAPRATLTAALGDLVRAPGARAADPGRPRRRRGRGDGRGGRHPAARPGGKALAHVLRERTGGNPFLVGELLRHLAETGSLDGGDVTEAATGPAADVVPESVRWVVGQRLARLGGPVEHVLGLVAVIGQQAELTLLRRVAGLGFDDLLAALDVAVAARLLEERPGPPGRYAFHHPIVRDLLYRRLPASERARAHRRVGEAARGAHRRRRPPRRSWPTTSRWPASPSPTGRWATPSGRASRPPPTTTTRRRPTATARPWPCWSGPAGPAADPERRVEPPCGQAGAWAAAGQARQATDAYLLAAAAARSAGSADGLARAALGLGGPTGFWSVDLGQSVPAGLLGEALDAAGPGDSPARALLLARLACWQAAGRLARGAWSRGARGRGPDPAGFAEAVAMARRLGDRADRSSSVLADQETAWHRLLRPGGPAAALAASAELDRLAAELGDDDLAWQAGQARAGALLAAGDLDGIDRLTEREAQAAQERRLPRHLWLSLRLRSAMAMLRGDFRDSERLATDADELGRRSIGARRGHGP